MPDWTCLVSWAVESHIYTALSGAKVKQLSLGFREIFGFRVGPLLSSPGYRGGERVVVSGPGRGTGGFGDKTPPSAYRWRGCAWIG